MSGRLSCSLVPIWSWYPAASIFRAFVCFIRKQVWELGSRNLELRLPCPQAACCGSEGLRVCMGRAHRVIGARERSPSPSGCCFVMRMIIWWCTRLPGD